MSKVLIDRELLERILPFLSDTPDLVQIGAEAIRYELRALLAQPAADWGLEVVAYTDSAGIVKLVNADTTGIPELVRKSDADARDAQRLERIASLDSDVRFFYDKMSDAEHDNEQLLAELSSLKAQEPVAWKCRHSIGEKWFLSDKPGYWECVPIYAALVPAQPAVVMPVRLSSFSDDEKGRALFTCAWNACLDELERLNGSKDQ